MCYIFCSFYKHLSTALFAPSVLGTGSDDRDDRWQHLVWGERHTRPYMIRMQKDNCYHEWNAHGGCTEDPCMLGASGSKEKRRTGWGNSMCKDAEVWKVRVAMLEGIWEWVVEMRPRGREDPLDKGLIIYAKALGSLPWDLAPQRRREGGRAQR